jgi:inner membrane protein
VDNVCHTLVGAALGEAGLKRGSRFSAAALMISANIPDLDVLVYGTDTPPVSFRRGWTHGILAQIALPILMTGVFWLLNRRRPQQQDGAPPFHAGWLLLLSYAGVYSHVFLDYLNNYGVRLLTPFDWRWFYGDAVFIVDVWLWIVLGAGTLLAGKSRPRYAVVALTIASLYIAGMLLSARAARAIVQDAWIARTGEAPRALMVGPVPLNPFRRTIILDAGDRYYEGMFRWMPRQIAFGETATPKNDSRPEIARASEDRRVHGILIWARFPVWDTREVPEGLEVSVRDMRFRALGRGGFTASTIVPH